MSKKSLIAGGVSLLFILITLFVGFYSKVKENKCLENSSQKTTGKVEEIVYYKGKSVKIYFIVKGDRYLAIETVYGSHSSVNKGDEYYVQYCEEDPSMNRILFDQKVLE